MKPFFTKSLKKFEDKKKAILEAAANFYPEQLDPEQSIPGLTDLYTPEKRADPPAPEQLEEPQPQEIDEPEEHVRDIADVLVEMGELDARQYEQLRQQQKRTQGKYKTAEDLLNRAELINSNVMLEAKARFYELEVRHLEPESIDENVFNKFEIDFIKATDLIPVAIEDDCLIVATSNPGNVLSQEDIKAKAEMDIRVVVCSVENIEKICNYFAEKNRPDYSVDEIINDMSDVEIVQQKVNDEFEDLEQMADQSPVIKFVNYLISNAIRDGASDIHIEPKAKYTKVKYRIDGILFEMMQSPLNMHPAVVSRIKIMANLDISERRLPQDGKVSAIVGGRGIDLRISILPTSHGEKVVIRVLDSKSILRGLDQLGMEPETTEVFAEQVQLPHGNFLVTGPTGSGKSTTLYSALNQMDGEKLNISTVEDPVEYELDFCNQVQVNDKIGMTFSAALRSLLRQDPDVIMIGEIRDPETAKIAVQAALTGHLVLSTLHTNDAPSSITRLVNIGVDAYLIAASLNAILAQRLVRRICSKCKETAPVADSMRKYLENTQLDANNLFVGHGCDYCRGSGYSGRVGIYELLVIDNTFRVMINKDPSVDNMRRVFRESGKASLFDDGLKKMERGLTTIEEVLRVTDASMENYEKADAKNA